MSTMSSSTVAGRGVGAIPERAHRRPRPGSAGSCGSAARRRPGRSARAGTRRRTRGWWSRRRRCRRAACPAPGSSHSGALSRRNRHAGRSRSGVSSTGAVGSPSTTPAASRTPSSTRSTIVGRAIVGSNAAAICVARAGRGRTPSRPAGRDGAPPSPERGEIVGVRLGVEGGGEHPQLARAAAAAPLSTRPSSGRIGTGRPAPSRSTTVRSRRVEEPHRVGIEVAAVERRRRGGPRWRAGARRPGAGLPSASSSGGPVRSRARTRRVWTASGALRTRPRRRRGGEAQGGAEVRVRRGRRRDRARGRAGAALAARRTRTGCARARGRRAPSPRRPDRSP